MHTEYAEKGYFIGKIEPEGTPFDVQTDTPVLLSAELGGIRLPSSCRVGSCRTCISLLTQGEVRYRMEWPGLSAEEKAEG